MRQLLVITMIRTYIFCIVCFFFSLSVWSQTLQIVVSPKPSTLPCDAYVVNFGIASGYTNKISSISWDFGDGSPLLTHSFSPAESPASGSPYVIPYHTYSPGKYTIKLKVIDDTNVEANATTATDAIKVGQTPVPIVEYRDSTTQYNVALRATLKDYTSPFPYTYEWTLDPNIIKNETLPAGTVESWFLHDFGAMGTYTLHLKISDELGCAFEGDATINAWNKIEAPNVFTPNDDGKNDEFVVNSNGSQTLSLKVYTRAGVLVYETEAKRIRWDGRMSSGEKVSTGVYFYVIESKEGANVKKSGFVYIYR